jgi:hypothetical protein
MFKRAGARVIPLLAATVALMIAAVVPASAAASRTTTLQENSACSFTVTYEWTGLGGGQNLTAHVQLLRYTATNTVTLVGFATHSPESGHAGGELSQFFTDSGQLVDHTYIAYGWLTNSRGRVIHNSQVNSAFTATPVTCS